METSALPCDVGKHTPSRDRIYVSTLPYLLLILAVMVIVTYWPALTLVPLGWFQ